MKLLLKLFVDDYQDINNAEVRSKYLKISSLFGIFLNIILFIFKIIVGFIFNSIAIIADALNSLTDAFSNIIGFISSILANRPADEKHPFGHERFEYLGSLLVSFVTLAFSISLAKESIMKIIHPEVLKFNWLMIIVLIFSIIIKLYMYYYNNKYGKLIDSTMMKATAIDSVGDCLAMSALIIAIFISYFSGFNLDGLMGFVVSLVIFKSGFEILKETVNELLGSAPDPKYVENISKEIADFDGILGVHDVIVHSYGPNRTFISAHAEVDSKVDIKISHDIIDNIEKAFHDKYQVALVLHMDPIDIDDPFTNKMRDIVANVVDNIDKSLSIHDFRVVRGETHINLIFDVVIPYSCKLDEDEVVKTIRKNMPKQDVNTYLVIGVDRM